MEPWSSNFFSVCRRFAVVSSNKRTSVWHDTWKATSHSSDGKGMAVSPAGKTLVGGEDDKDLRSSLFIMVSFFVFVGFVLFRWLYYLSCWILHYILWIVSIRRGTQQALRNRGDKMRSWPSGGFSFFPVGEDGLLGEEARSKATLFVIEQVCVLSIFLVIIIIIFFKFLVRLCMLAECSWEWK